MQGVVFKIVDATFMVRLNIASTAIDRFRRNNQEILRFFYIKETIGGNKEGKVGGNSRVLTNASLVLMIASLETFVEDLAREAMVAIYLSAPNRHSLLEGHLVKVIERETDRFRTPTTEKIDELFRDTINLDSLSSHWHWKGMTVVNARRKLNKMVRFRHQIVHNVGTTLSLSEASHRDLHHFVNQLAYKSNGVVIQYLNDNGVKPLSLNWTYSRKLGRALQEIATKIPIK